MPAIDSTSGPSVQSRGFRTSDCSGEETTKKATPLVALLTGGGDKPYAIGLATALSAAGTPFDFIGSDDLDVPELRNDPLVHFRNLRGNQRPEAPLLRKAFRLLWYYFRLIGYALTAQPRVFHILWNNKFEFFDRTILMLFYRSLGKRIVLTAHNVNTQQRDERDSWLNRLTLRIQYHLTSHVFVHAELMRQQLETGFGVSRSKITVIPFGINNTLPNTSLTTGEARRNLGFSEEDRIILFFGNIAPYKGLEYLILAFAELNKTCEDYRLLITGRPKDCPEYWKKIQDSIAEMGIQKWVLTRTDYIPDKEVEVYFKAADVFVLPYTRIFQSGVLFLGYSFGLPVIAADVGSLREEIVEGKTGFVAKAGAPADLARLIGEYFGHDLFCNLEAHRKWIRAYANERYSWDKVGRTTNALYSQLLGN